MAHLCAYIDREIGQCFVIQRLPQDQSTFQGVYEHEVILKKKKKKCFVKISFIQEIKRMKNGTECGPGKTAYCTVENGPG